MEYTATQVVNLSLGGVKVVSIKQTVLAAAIALTTASVFAQTTTVASNFAQQMAPVLDRITAMQPKGKYSQQTTADLDKLLKVAKSDAEVGEVTFLQQDVSGYLVMETKPANTARRKQCLADIKTGNASGDFDKTKSKACSRRAITRLSRRSETKSVRCTR